MAQCLNSCPKEKYVDLIDGEVQETSQSMCDI